MDEQELKKKYTRDFCQAKMRHERPREDQSDMAHGQFGVLAMLERSGHPLTPGQLASAFHVGSSRVANMLKELEKKDLVKREQDKADKRKTLVTLTEKGQSICQIFRESFEDSIYAFVKEVGEEEFYRFLALEKKLCDCLEKSGKEKEKIWLD